ncbi:MAG: shikimate kinase [Gemmatimonadales bacterium]
MTRRHLVLVGLPGSGKSTVGPLVAAQLDTHFTDLDPVIVRATGLTVADLFETEGEAAFRTLERQALLDALLLPPHVVAPGGGWAAEPGNLDEVRERITAIYLRVLPAVAAGRLDGALDRPLLAGGDVEGRLRVLLAAREGCYRSAGQVVDANDEPGLVTDRVVAAARSAGW